MNIRKTLFYTIQNTKDKYDLYEKLTTYVEKIVNDTKRRRKCKIL